MISWSLSVIKLIWQHMERLQTLPREKLLLNTYDCKRVVLVKRV